MRSGEDGLKADAVAAAFPKILSSLKGDSLSHGHSTDPSGLETGRESGSECFRKPEKRVQINKDLNTMI